ncbi:MAG: tetratricopeptide repeat protein [Akkermansiaceae bacterium]|nr:tetratricopeptide repeat protein [Armatimonadota bacterium]
MFRKVKRWWNDNALLIFAQGLLGTLRTLFRIEEMFAPPQRQAKLRRFREEIEADEREKNDLLREIDSMVPHRTEEMLDKVDAFGAKHGTGRDDSEWQAQRAMVRADRAELDALVAINESAGEDNVRAIAAFEAYITANPQSSSAYKWLAGRLTKSADYDAALAAYETAIRLHPSGITRYITVVTIKNAVAEVHFLKGDTNAAIRSFKEAIAESPESKITLRAMSYLGLGNLYEKIGNMSEAKVAWKKAIAYDETGVVKAEAQKKLKSR